MKSVTDILHKAPWWALLLGGVATLFALAVFVTPYHILQYRDHGRTAEESRAIKREIDNAFAENALNLVRGVLKGLLERTKDPGRRAELEQALAGLEEARKELREVGSEVIRAKRDALDAAKEATRAAREAVAEAKRALGGPLKRAQPEEIAAVKEAEKALKQAQLEERKAARELRRAERGVRIHVGPSDKPTIDIEVDPAPPEVPAVPASPEATPPAPPEGAVPALPSLPPEVATKIRRDVTGDIYRIGIGAALVLILVPLFIVAVVVKFFADRSRASQKVADLKRKEADYHRMGQQVTEAKLSALQAQVEPHFLYNTLASVQALTEVDPAKANEMTGHLIQYLRNALPKMRESVSTVGQEVELARAYLNILQMRMGKRLAFEIDVAPELTELPFPPLMLPSLVENAIKHGLEPQREGGTVRIGAAVTDGKLRLMVSDTGRGFPETPGTGVGLANIRERLAGLYGDKARLTLEANTPHGVVATIEVPVVGTRAAAPGAAAASSGAAPGAASTSAASGMPPISPTPQPAAEIPPTGFWARTWEVLVVMERVWRLALYYLYIGLVIVAGVAILVGIVAVAVGAVPVVIEKDVIPGPFGVLLAMAAGIVGFIAAAAALAIAMLVIYGVGYLILGVLFFVLCVALISLSPVLAPIILLGLIGWWMVRRSRREAQPAR